jgi:hypothetical protein
MSRKKIIWTVMFEELYTFTQVTGTNLNTEMQERLIQHSVSRILVQKYYYLIIAMLLALSM